MTLLFNGKPVTFPAHFSGTAHQLFSDRTYTWPGNGSLFPPTYPFNPFLPDQLGVSIDAATGKVTLTLKSWGSVSVSLDTLADPGAGVIYGFAQAGAGRPRQMVTISLQKLFLAIPK